MRHSPSFSEKFCLRTQKESYSDQGSSAGLPGPPPSRGGAKQPRGKISGNLPSGTCEKIDFLELGRLSM
jgi:hypothetical protein